MRGFAPRDWLRKVKGSRPPVVGSPGGCTADWMWSRICRFYRTFGGFFLAWVTLYRNWVGILVREWDTTWVIRSEVYVQTWFKTGPAMDIR